MIRIIGSVHRTFIFPAPLESAFEFYADIERTLGFLTHISLVQRRSDRQYRMLYHTSELGVYRIKMYCDIDVQLDRQARVLRITPSTGIPPVAQEIGVYSLSAQGTYSSQSVFTPMQDQTQIDYQLNLNASMPVPYGVRFMPGSVLNSIAHGITEWRMHEIAEGFIERSIRYYTSKSKAQ